LVAAGVGLATATLAADVFTGGASILDDPVKLGIAGGMIAAGMGISTAPETSIMY